MASRGEPAIRAVSAGRVSAGGRRMGAAPPGMETLRKSAAMAGPAGTCCTHGASSPRRMTAPQTTRAAAIEIRLPDFKRHLRQAQRASFRGAGTLQKPSDHLLKGRGADTRVCKRRYPVLPLPDV